MDATLTLEVDFGLPRKELNTSINFEVDGVNLSIPLLRMYDL